LDARGRYARPMTTNSAVAEFRRLHESGCFVMPNPWDVGSARVLAQMGFKALATTSAGFAFTQGLPDSPISVTVEDVLVHAAEIVRASGLPVNADFQNAYSREPDGVFRNVTACVHTGVAGLSVEDASGDASASLYDRELALERVKAARAAIDETGIPVVLTARCEAFIVGHPDTAREAIERLVAFADAGADCLFAPGIRVPGQIVQLVKAVAPKPVNVVVSSHIPELTVARLAEIGVRRVSLGAGLAKVAWGAFMRAAREISETGRFDSLGTGASIAELNTLFSKR
jgi:2-methylisocitrate lyase-like PEP mutase family enzyme